MMVIRCDICDAEIEEQGSVFMTNPGDSDEGVQYDLCESCTGAVRDILRTMQREHGIEPEPLPIIEEELSDEGLT